MSWSAPALAVRKKDIKKALSELELTGDNASWAIDQFEGAKDAVLELVKGIPGSYVVVNMSGHANGIGYNKKESWSNDFVSISVGQLTTAEYEKYYAPKE